MEGLMTAIQTTVFFDLDGTIVEDFFGKVILPMVVATLARWSGVDESTLRHEIADERHRRTANPRMDNYARSVDYDQIVDTIAARHGIASRLPDYLCFKLVSRHAPYKAKSLEGAYDVLSQLHQVGIDLVVSTLGLFRYQSLVLQALGLLKFFADCLAPDTVGFLKTDPRFLQRYQALNTLKISVGDSLRDDIYMPHLVGFKTVLVFHEPDLRSLNAFERPHHLDRYAHKLRYYEEYGGKVQPDAVITQLAELPDVVYRLQENGATAVRAR